MREDMLKNLNNATSQWGGDITGFTIISKETAIEIKNLDTGPGSLRLPSDLTVTVKFISLESIQDNTDALAKLIKASESGRLGAQREDGVLLFREDLTRHFNDGQTVLIRNKATGEEETRTATVEGISEENYSLVQAALAILNPTVSATNDVKKEEKTTKNEPASHKNAGAGGIEVKAKPNSQFAQKMESELSRISARDDEKSKAARQKEEAEKKEQERQIRKQKQIRTEDLKWDLKQGEIEKEGIQSDVQKQENK